MRPRSLFVRLTATHLLVAIAAVAVLGLAIDRVFEHRAITDLEARLISEAKGSQTAIGARDPTVGLEEYVQKLGSSLGARLTIIRTDGLVLADSQHDPSTMENHATPSRPEVLAAIAGRMGIDQRRSETLGEPFLYVALPARDGTIVRAALPATTIAAQRATVRRTVAYSLLGIVVVALGLSSLVARTVSRPLKRVADEVTRVAEGEYATVDESGPAETRQLVQAVNDMAGELARRHAELRNEADLRDQILSAMDEAVVLEDNGIVVFANAAAERLVHATTGRPAPPALPRPDGNDPLVTELSLYHPAYREVRVTSAALAGNRFLFVVQDVTEASRIDRIRRDFVANASHELKTPVAGILAAAETLQSAIDEDPEAARRFAASLRNEATRLSNLIQDLLDLARFDRVAGEDQIAKLSQLVESAVDEFRRSADEKQLMISTTIQEEIEVRSGADDLTLLVRNLLDNAIRYTPKNGKISVSLARSGDSAELRVSDTGIGIPAKEIPRIFERFYRVDKARARNTGGTGLGLSIVRHIAESNGGSVVAESTLGVGSTFIVMLPALHDGHQTDSL